MAVNDNNPLYGSFTYGGGYSNAGGSTVSDTYWADFLFGTTNTYSLANYYVAHLTPEHAQPLCAGRLEGRSQADPQPRSALGVRFALRRPVQPHLELRSRFPDGTHHHPRRRRRQRHHSGLSSAGPTARPSSILTSPTSARAWASLTQSIPKTAHSWRIRHQLRRTTPEPAPAISSASTHRRHSSPRSPKSHQPPPTIARLRFLLRSSRSTAQLRSCFATSDQGTRAASSPASTPPPTTSPTSPKTPKTATSRATSSASSAPGKKHPARYRLRRQSRRQATGLPQRQPEEPLPPHSPVPTPTGRLTSPRP